MFTERKKIADSKNIFNDLNKLEEKKSKNLFLGPRTKKPNIIFSCFNWQLPKLRRQGPLKPNYGHKAFLGLKDTGPCRVSRFLIAKIE